MKMIGLKERQRERERERERKTKRERDEYMRQEKAIVGGGARRDRPEASS